MEGNGLNILTLGSDDELRIIDPDKFYVLKDSTYFRGSYYPAYQCNDGYCLLSIDNKDPIIHVANKVAAIINPDDSRLQRFFRRDTLQETIKDAVTLVHNSRLYLQNATLRQVAQFDNSDEFFRGTW